MKNNAVVNEALFAGGHETDVLLAPEANNQGIVGSAGATTDPVPGMVGVVDDYNLDERIDVMESGIRERLDAMATKSNEERSIIGDMRAIIVDQVTLSGLRTRRERENADELEK
jgi:hypothetical protein